MGWIRRIVGAVSRRVPAHAADRAAAALLPKRPFEQLTLPPEGALSVICDDGETRDLDIVEVLQRHGAHGVFAVSPDLVGREGFLGYGDLRQMRAGGHEIAFHGTTHDPFTSFDGPAALRKAIDAGVAQLEAEGLGRPPTLIYPYGSNNRWVRQAVAEVFDSAFSTWYGINGAHPNRYAMRRVPFGAYTGKLPATESWYRGLIDESARSRGWLALMLHPAAPQHTTEHTEMLGRLLAYAQERGLPVRTVAAHLQHHHRPHPALAAQRAVQ